MIDARFCVAPMIDWTDRHCRYFHRLLAPSAMLYTEMITAAAIEHGDVPYLLGHKRAEHPLALQLGGADCKQMARAVDVAARYDFDEYNINVGCPSDRVQSGRFGACLMAEPKTVLAVYRAMQAATNKPVTVKTRLGIDDHDSDEFLFRLLDPLVDDGLGCVILHARIAILSGLSPKENRTVPPLNYDRVYRVRDRYPQIRLVLNGGVQTLVDSLKHLSRVDAVMIGREAYQNPWFLTALEAELGEGIAPPSRDAVLLRYRHYIVEELASGQALAPTLRPVLGLYSGQPGARRWRRYLSENMHRAGAGVEVLDAGLELVTSAAA